MKSSSSKVWIIISTGLWVTITAFLLAKDWRRCSSAYVVNQEIFSGFDGRVELNQKLEYVKSRHKQVLDSLYAQTENAKDEGALRALSQKSRQFMEDEQALSKRYTQQIWKQINTYLNDYGKEKNYEMIFGADGSGSLMYAGETVNITDEVLEYINKRYAGEK